MVLSDFESLQEIRHFPGHSGLYRVKQGKYGIFNASSGGLLVPTEFDHVGYCSSECDFRMVLVERNGLVGMYDSREKSLVIPIEYSNIDCPHTADGLKTGSFYYLVARGRAEGVYSIQERCLVVPLEYDWCGIPANGYYAVSRGRRSGVFGVREKRLVLPLEYDDVSELTSEDYEVSKDNQHYSFNPVTGGLIQLPG